jgi:hypothetical protein
MWRRRLFKPTRRDSVHRCQEDGEDRENGRMEEWENGKREKHRRPVYQKAGMLI